MSGVPNRRPRVSWLLIGLGLVLVGPPARAGESSGGKAAAGANPSAGLSQATQSSPSGIASMESAQPAAISGRPTVEIQRGSGDFATFHDSIVVDGSTPVRLRWSPILGSTAKAAWSTRSWPIGPPAAARPQPAGNLASAPQPGHWHYVDVNLFQGRGGLPAGATRYELTLQGQNAAGSPVGEPSLPVVVDYKPPGSGPAQVIQLDQVQLLDWNPKSGLMTGPNGDQHSQYGANEKVDLSFHINLITEDQARLSNSLIGADGGALEGNFYTFVDLNQKGGHTKSNFVTIRCDAGLGNPYYEQTATGLRWKLFKKGSGQVLSEGSKTFATPLVWRCPGKDQLDLVAKAPATGVLRGIENPNQANSPGRSVELTYSYRLGTQPKAVVKQLPFMNGYDPVPNEYWTSTKVSNGTGTATNRLSVYCQSELQPDVHVTNLRYTLAKEGTGEAILQEVVPVDFTFTCKPLKIAPALIQGGGALQSIGEPGGTSPGGSRMQKVAPAERRGWTVAPGARPGVKASPSSERMQKVTPSPREGIAPAVPEEDAEKPGVRGLRTIPQPR